MRLLVIGNNLPLNGVIATTLRGSGWQVELAQTVPHAVTLLDRAVGYDLVVVDWLSHSGAVLTSLDFVRRVRLGRHPRTRVILLTNRASPADKTAGFTAGADDVVEKPFYTMTLLRRVDAQAQKLLELRAQEQLVFGALRFYPETRVVAAHNKRLPLTQQEFRLLHYFAVHSDRIVTRREVVTEVWGEYDAGALSNTVEVHISRLRRKLEMLGARFVTQRGVGYQLIVR